MVKNSLLTHVKDKITRLIKTNTTNNYSKLTSTKTCLMVARNQWNWKYKNNLKPTGIKVSSAIKSKWSDQRPNKQRTFLSKKNNYYKPVKVG